MVMAHAIFLASSSAAHRRFQMSRAAARAPRSLVRAVSDALHSSLFFTRLCEKQRVPLDRVTCEQVLISRCGVKGLD